MNILKSCKQLLIVTSMLFSFTSSYAQTDQDAIMMNKNLFCTGLNYSYSSWNKYWEGTNLRDNLNIGTISTNQISVMGNYGIKDNLNILFNAPFISNKASMGVLHPASGIQDFSTWIKWMPIETSLKNGTFSLYLLGGASVPMTDYIVDYLPLSIGLKSSTVSGRLLLDYQVGKFFVTGSETYSIRGNTKLERNSYYTTSLFLTNEVSMPNVNTISLRTGYRSSVLIAEAIITDMKTLGGFDITKNNMPFPSNRMNATTIAANIKYEIQKVSGLALVGGASHVIAGRNVGQSTGFYGGFFYILDFSKKKEKKTTSDNSSTQNK
ncbi:MAG: hypothetical protein WCJ80_09285 [Bacteroidota bacterium]